MEFEFDPEKSRMNAEKHGLRLEVAMDLWSIKSITLPTSATGEERWLQVGKLYNKFYTCVFTLRGPVVRLISIRRSRKSEVRAYEEESQKNQSN